MTLMTWTIWTSTPMWTIALAWYWSSSLRYSLLTLSDTSCSFLVSFSEVSCWCWPGSSLFPTTYWASPQWSFFTPGGSENLASSVPAKTAVLSATSPPSLTNRDSSCSSEEAECFSALLSGGGSSSSSTSSCGLLLLEQLESSETELLDVTIRINIFQMIYCKIIDSSCFDFRFANIRHMQFKIPS